MMHAALLPVLAIQAVLLSMSPKMEWYTEMVDSKVIVPESYIQA